MLLLKYRNFTFLMQEKCIILEPIYKKPNDERISWNIVDYTQKYTRMRSKEKFVGEMETYVVSLLHSKTE